MGLIKRKKNKMEEKFNIKFILQTDRIVRKWATTFCDCPFKKLHLI